MLTLPCDRSLYTAASCGVGALLTYVAVAKWASACSWAYCNDFRACSSAAAAVPAALPLATFLTLPCDRSLYTAASWGVGALLTYVAVAKWASACSWAYCNDFRACSSAAAAVPAALPLATFLTLPCDRSLYTAASWGVGALLTYVAVAKCASACSWAYCNDFRACSSAAAAVPAALPLATFLTLPCDRSLYTAASWGVGALLTYVAVAKCASACSWAYCNDFRACFSAAAAVPAPVPLATFLTLPCDRSLYTAASWGVGALLTYVAVAKCASACSWAYCNDFRACSSAAAAVPAALPLATFLTLPCDRSLYTAASWGVGALLTYVAVAKCASACSCAYCNDSRACSSSAAAVPAPVPLATFLTLPCDRSLYTAASWGVGALLTYVAVAKCASACSWAYCNDFRACSSAAAAVPAPVPLATFLTLPCDRSLYTAASWGVGALLTYVAVAKCANACSWAYCNDFRACSSSAAAVPAALPLATFLTLPCDRSLYTAAFWGVGALLTYVAVAKCASACSWAYCNDFRACSSAAAAVPAALPLATFLTLPCDRSLYTAASCGVGALLTYVAVAKCASACSWAYCNDFRACSSSAAAVPAALPLATFLTLPCDRSLYTAASWGVGALLTYVAVAKCASACSWAYCNDFRACSSAAAAVPAALPLATFLTLPCDRSLYTAASCGVGALLTYVAVAKWASACSWAYCNDFRACSSAAAAAVPAALPLATFLTLPCDRSLYTAASCGVGALLTYVAVAKWASACSWAYCNDFRACSSAAAAVPAALPLATFLTLPCDRSLYTAASWGVGALLTYVAVAKCASACSWAYCNDFRACSSAAAAAVPAPVPLATFLTLPCDRSLYTAASWGVGALLTYVAIAKCASACSWAYCNDFRACFSAAAAVPAPVPLATFLTLPCDRSLYTAASWGVGALLTYVAVAKCASACSCAYCNDFRACSSAAAAVPAALPLATFLTLPCDRSLYTAASWGVGALLTYVAVAKCASACSWAYCNDSRACSSSAAAVPAALPLATFLTLPCDRSLYTAASWGVGALLTYVAVAKCASACSWAYCNDFRACSSAAAAVPAPVPLATFLTLPCDRSLYTAASWGVGALLTYVAVAKCASACSWAYCNDFRACSSSAAAVPAALPLATFLTLPCDRSLYTAASWGVGALLTYVAVAKCASACSCAYCNDFRACSSAAAAVPAPVPLATFLTLPCDRSLYTAASWGVGALLTYVAVAKCASACSWAYCNDFRACSSSAAAVPAALPLATFLTLPCDRSLYTAAFWGVGALLTYVAVAKCASACSWAYCNDFRACSSSAAAVPAALPLATFLTLPCDRSLYTAASCGVGALLTYVAVAKCARACSWAYCNDFRACSSSAAAVPAALPLATFLTLPCDRSLYTAASWGVGALLTYVAVAKCASACSWAYCNDFRACSSAAAAVPAALPLATFLTLPCDRSLYTAASWGVGALLTYVAVAKCASACSWAYCNDFRACSSAAAAAVPAPVPLATFLTLPCDRSLYTAASWGVGALLTYVAVAKCASACSWAYCNDFRACSSAAAAAAVPAPVPLATFLTLPCDCSLYTAASWGVGALLTYVAVAKCASACSWAYCNDFRACSSAAAAVPAALPLATFLTLPCDRSLYTAASWGVGALLTYVAVAKCASACSWAYCNDFRACSSAAAAVPAPVPLAAFPALPCARFFYTAAFWGAGTLITYRR